MRNLFNVVICIAFTLILILILIGDGGWFKKSSYVKQLNKHFTETNQMQNLSINYGIWKPGKRHNQTCDIIPKMACCKNKQNLHFEFHEDRLNQIDAVEELRKILKRKKVLLIGDSVMAEFFVGLSELLHVKPEEKTKHFCGLNCTIHPGNNGIVTFLEACIIELEGQKKNFDVKEWRVVSEEVIRREIFKYDIIIFNQGQHHESRFSISESSLYFTDIGKMLHGKNKKSFFAFRENLRHIQTVHKVHHEKSELRVKIPPQKGLISFLRCNDIVISWFCVNKLSSMTAV